MKKTLILFAFFFGALVQSYSAQTAPVSVGGLTLYNKIRAFELTGGRAEVANLELARDRVKMTFNGTFYFTSAIEGRVAGAVFIGRGTFRAEPPPSKFEQENVRRMLNADAVESDFKTAILRFTDDTFDIIGATKSDAPADATAQKMALESDARVIRETGANLASRLAISMLNEEKPGFFHAMFDGGKRDRFSFVLDYQTRIPTDYFGINGGEKGLIYSHKSALFGIDIWMAFYALENYASNYVDFSDSMNMIDVASYRMEIDLRAPRSRLGLRTKISLKSRLGNLRAVPFSIGDTLGEFRDYRLEKQMRIKTVKLGVEAVEVVQEDWEGAMTVFLPRPLKKGEDVELEFDLEGDFIQQPLSIPQAAHYPLSNDSWFPTHGYLDRATFDMTFLHSKKLKVAAMGTRESEQISPDDSNVMVTTYRIKQPVSFVTFALAGFLRKSETIKWENGDPPTLLEYSSVDFERIDEKFVLTELNNAVRYFQALFGKYPYDTYGAAHHPFPNGQGFPSLILIPNASGANKYNYLFIAHETAHQWWGNAVAWRSYRDLWLSEGFAEYSALLYTAVRKDQQASLNFLEDKRKSLTRTPQTRDGVGKGRIHEVGPLILGHRLHTSKTQGAYGPLIYNKGALVLRMLHFLFTDPQTGSGDEFFALMKAFVERHRNGFASTEDFMAIANERFPSTPLARKYQLRDLNWFFRQWVYETSLPSYTLEYSLKDQPDGSCIVSGTILQENTPPSWAMILPIKFSIGKKSEALTTVAAVGPQSQFNLKLPQRPDKVELDPHNWVLSEKTRTIAK